MNLNNVFEKIFIISRKEKKESIKFGDFDFEFFDAIIPNLPMPQRSRVGNRLSHLEIIKKAKQFDYKNVLVFEEDIVFDKDIKYEILLDKIIDFVKNSDWCCFYLGGRHRSKRVEKTNNDNILRTYGTIATHAIAYNSNYYDKLIDLFSADENHPYPIDYFLCGSVTDKEYFCKHNPCYSIYPRFVLQKSGKNILGTFYPEEYWKEN